MSFKFWIYFAFIVLLGVFSFLLIRFAIKTNFSFTSFEKITPALGAVLFGIYILTAAIYTTKESKSYANYYSTIIFRNKNTVITPPLFFKTVDPNVSNNKFYFGLLLNGSVLPLMYPTNMTETEYTDFFEYCFLNTLPLSGDLDESEAIKINLKDNMNNFSKNSYINYSHEELTKKENLNPNGPRTNVPIKESLGQHFFYIPKNSKFFYKNENDGRRVYEVVNPNFKISVILMNGGMTNFRPEYNGFHRWIANQEVRNVEMRKFVIFVNIERYKYFELLDEKDRINKYFESIKSNVDNNFSWNGNEKNLNSIYQTEMLEKILSK